LGVVLQSTVEIVKDHHGRENMGQRTTDIEECLLPLRRKKKRNWERNPSRTKGAKSSEAETRENCKREEVW